MNQISKQSLTTLETFDELHEKFEALKVTCLSEFLKIFQRTDARRDAEVEAGNFVYYVVDEDTNDRKTLDDGTPIIYATQDAAGFACRGYDKVISIAAYDRLYGRFMSNESFAARYS